MQPNPASSARRILIVDTDLDFAARLSVALLRSGYETECAATRDQMLAAIAKQHPQIVICDVQYLDGVVKVWTEQSVLPNPLCIALAGKPDLEIALKAFRLGATDFLLKDKAPIEMIAMLDRCFKK